MHNERMSTIDIWEINDNDDDDDGYSEKHSSVTKNLIQSFQCERGVGAGREFNTKKSDSWEIEKIQQKLTKAHTNIYLQLHILAHKSGNSIEWISILNYKEQSESKNENMNEGRRNGERETETKWMRKWRNTSRIKCTCVRHCTNNNKKS